MLTLVYTEIPTTSQSGQRWSLVYASYVLFNPLSPGDAKVFVKFNIGAPVDLLPSQHQVILSPCTV